MKFRPGLIKELKEARAQGKAWRLYHYLTEDIVELSVFDSYQSFLKHDGEFVLLLSGDQVKEHTRITRANLEMMIEYTKKKAIRPNL